MKLKLTKLGKNLRLIGVSAVFCLSAALIPSAAYAVDLGVEGQIYEPIEVDFRQTLLRMVAAHDWDPQIEELQDGFKNYTKNLPALYLPLADKTLTRWKDVGVVVTEDIYMPWVDLEHGSVFEPESVLAVAAGTYLNPIDKLPAAAIERLFVFDATDVVQLELAKSLMKEKIPQLNFMLIAGDLGPLSEEMGMPIFYPSPQMLERFSLRAVPSLLGFGRGAHHGHMAITEFSLPSSVAEVKSAWFGLGDVGLDEFLTQRVAEDSQISEISTIEKTLGAISILKPILNSEDKK